MKEVVDKELDTIAVLTESVAELTVAVKAQHDVILVLLHNMDLKIPDWKETTDVEKEVGPKIQQCMDLMKRVYGRSETNKG